MFRVVAFSLRLMCRCRRRAGWISNGRLMEIWRNSIGGTSPIVAGGLLYVYNPNGGLHVYDPLTGTTIATPDCGGGHWNSPTAGDGRIALSEGNANNHATAGVLDVWTVLATR